MSTDLTASTRVMMPSAAAHVPHALHAHDRIWPETNCYVDLWIELLHAIGADPLAALAFTVSAGFDGEQWEFFKFPPEDLRFAYGIEVSELNIWRSVEDHIITHLDLGHLMTIESDAMHLPDTAGDSYGLQHQKTTIAPSRIDPGARRLTYFHSRGCFELSGDDYDAIVNSDSPWPPYAERIDLSRLVLHDEDGRRAVAEALLGQHLARRPFANPVLAMADRIAADTPWLRANPSEVFHRYAFGTLRQCGAWAEVLADFVGWLRPDEFASCSLSLRELSSTAKTCQFKLARVANGRDADLSGLFDTMAAHWDAAYEVLVGAS
ncbi:MAG: hypothetical protein JWN62_4581 [Acidimicrobiales bacterium]|nr:hypothetical protein [Acidimicrobiales bacterium]